LPSSYSGRSVPVLHAWLLLAIGLTALQLVPLPGSLVDVISPHVRPTVSRLLLVTRGALPLTIDERKTRMILLVNASLVVIFLAALRIFADGGVRNFARGVALLGFVLATVALAQDATAQGLVYWRWKLVEQGPRPFGPFINRNHFATWTVLAIPLIVGYLAAHAGAHDTRGAIPVPLRRRIVTFFDGRALLLSASSCLLAVALVVTLSRSGMMALAASAACGAALWMRRSSTSGRMLWWIAAAGVGAIALTLAALPVAAIIERLGRTNVSAADRLTIWKDTLPMIRDFWLTGTGAGTYETGMLVYQRASPGVRFNTAHNHYLQSAAEGGLLLGGTIFVALAVYARDAWSRLWADRSGVFWIRAGALCGLAGAAAQSFWETGLLMPANAVLAAILAAIVVHEPHQPSFDVPSRWQP